jgi:hypothetical protein
MLKSLRQSVVVFMIGTPMKRYLVGFSFALALLALPHIASAQSLKGKLVGAYILVEGSEVFADGKKVVPWAKGSLQLSPTGRASFFVLPMERAKTDSVRTPAGPMVAWYGSYTVDEAASTFTRHGRRCEFAWLRRCKASPDDLVSGRYDDADRQQG